ncbi:hypothetical protein T230_08260 [Tannerella sp. oral taxon BU063 isolate Cell 1/3]|uniref:Uncharacterized protein n=1 Tax=Tannerella sp. oral taxon BU063 isolate Cell 1/3 TaxID=1411022 RepID=W2CNE5_9BACT|nr:hypothetical protein T230_08260 [Tannerella sp. oral taxon BU063 isolate Cell 1/3]
MREKELNKNIHGLIALTMCLKLYFHIIPHVQDHETSVKYLERIYSFEMDKG